MRRPGSYENMCCCLVDDDDDDGGGHSVGAVSGDCAQIRNCIGDGLKIGVL